MITGPDNRDRKERAASIRLRGPLLFSSATKRFHAVIYGHEHRRGDEPALTVLASVQGLRAATTCRGRSYLDISVTGGPGVLFFNVNFEPGRWFRLLMTPPPLQPGHPGKNGASGVISRYRIGTAETS